MNTKLISIIIPTYKEAQNIPVLLGLIKESIKSRYDYEIVIVDDDSRDGIEAEVEKLQKEGHRVLLIIRKNEKGLSSAVIEGLKRSVGDICLVMDADLSHPPAKIPEMIDEIAINNFEFVVGSRFIKGGGAAHFNIYRKLNALASRLLALPFSKSTDPMAGFFAFPRRIIENRLDMLNPIGFKIGLEIYVKCNPSSLKEIPIQFQSRLYGKSKLNLKEQINYIRHIGRLSEFKYQTISEFIKFGFVGGSGVVVNLLCIYIFYGLIKIPYTLATMFSFIIALTSNFYLNRVFTFLEARKTHFFKQYAKYFVTCLLGFAVYWITSVYLYNSWHFFQHFYVIPSLIGIIFGTIVNFVGSKLFVFNMVKS